MCAPSILLLCSVFWSYGESASFDQRQTGNLNVQVDLKDIHIIALMKGGKEEYVDYDYAYDYSEMTIKPQNGSTTSKPLNATTEAENNTMATTELDQSTESIKNDTWLSETTTPTLQTTITAIDPASTSSTTEKSTETLTTTTSTPILNDKNITVIQAPSNTTDCKKGFVLNLKGDCELKLQSTGNALLKLVKLSQRLKLKRENRRNQNNSA